MKKTMKIKTAIAALVAIMFGTVPEAKAQGPVTLDPIAQLPEYTPQNPGPNFGQVFAQRGAVKIGETLGLALGGALGFVFGGTTGAVVGGATGAVAGGALIEWLYRIPSSPAPWAPPQIPLSFPNP